MKGSSRWPPLVAALAWGTLFSFGLFARGQESTPVPIRFRGHLPGTMNPALNGKFPVEFRLYRSPQGGEPIWRETQEVVVKGGMIDVLVGLTQAIPAEVHESTFKWLGASVAGSREVYPRYHVVNVVYVSLKEALLAREGKMPPSGDDPPERPQAVVDSQTQQPSTWVEALRTARARGADLPEYQDWYRAILACPADEVAARCGHYEWVLPWAYDTASHGLYNQYFRGRFQGCDYMDLSPEKSYLYRFARKPVEKKVPPGPEPTTTGKKSP